MIGQETFNIGSKNVSEVVLMKARDLIAFLDGKLSGSVFEKALSGELMEWRRCLKERGRSVRLSLEIDDGESPRITDLHLAYLLGQKLTGKVSGYFLAYVADALLMSKEVIFSNEGLKDILEYLSEFQDAGSVNDQNATIALGQLTGDKAG